MTGQNAQKNTAVTPPVSGPKLFDIWEADDIFVLVPWRAQMVNYVAYFKTKEHAERFVDAVKKFRNRGK
jgi:hypothetical protein